MQTLSLFVEVEGAGFSKKAIQALPLLVCNLSPMDPIETVGEAEDEEAQSGGEEEVEGVESSALMETDVSEEITCDDTCPPVKLSLGGSTEPPVAQDHLLFTTLTCLGKMLSVCSGLIRSPPLQATMNEVWGELILLSTAWCYSLTHTGTNACTHCVTFPLLQNKLNYSSYTLMLGSGCLLHDSLGFSLLLTNQRSSPLG